MKILRDIFENLNRLSQQNKLLKCLKPVIAATDEFFFGTDKVTASPHIVDHIDIKRFMSFVIIGLLPATIAAIYFWGLRVLLVIAISYTFGGLIEVVFAAVRKKEIHEGFLVTGLIFPLILPPTVPLWMVAVGVMFGVIFGKEVFGGTGRNVFNASIVGRIFLSVAFPQAMTVSWSQPFHQGLGGFLKFSADAATQATPLALFKNDMLITNFWDLFFVNSLGCIGETFRLGIILGGLFLILDRKSNWRLPLAAILSVLFFSFLGNLFAAQKFAPPLFQILSGGLLLDRKSVG